MKLRRIAEGLIVRHDSGHWVPLRGEGLTDEESQDMVAFLAGGEETRAAAEAMLAGIEDPAAEAVDPAAASIPFQPRSMRAFMLWESHVIASSRMLVKRFFPPPAAKAVARIRAPHRQDVPEAEAEQALPRGADLLRRQPRGAAGRRRGDVVAVAHRVARLRARAGLRAGPAARRRHARGGAAAVGGWFVAQRLDARATCRPTTPARTSSARWSSRRRSPTRSAPTCSPPTQCPTGPG